MATRPTSSYLRAGVDTSCQYRLSSFTTLSIITSQHYHLSALSTLSMNHNTPSSFFEVDIPDGIAETISTIVRAHRSAEFRKADQLYGTPPKEVIVSPTCSPTSY